MDKKREIEEQGFQDFVSFSNVKYVLVVFDKLGSQRTIYREIKDLGDSLKDMLESQRVEIVDY